MREFIAHIEANPREYQDVESIVNYITSSITRYRDMTGSLQRRLDFLLDRVGTHTVNNTIKKTRG